MVVAAKLHYWPWSCANREEFVDLVPGEADFPFYGSPLISLTEGSKLFLPVRHERFHALGPPFNAPFQGGACQMFETPHGVLSDERAEKRLTLHFREQRHRITLNPNGALLRHEGAKDGIGRRKSALASIISYWTGYFDELLDEAGREAGEGSRLRWPAVYEHLCKLAEEQKQGDPRRALIVNIAERMHRPLPATVAAARRILVRERCVIAAGRIEEIDDACILWYIRQPGRTAVEKAGPRQELRGVTRRETHDVHENRVLKDFLSRCHEEGRRYCREADAENPAFRDSSIRYRKVKKFSTLCLQLAAAPHLEGVASPVAGTPPNYVLLHDLRYREVWHWYRKLLRRKEEEDCIWDWQPRTWADISRVLVNLALRYHIDKQSRQDALRLEDVCQASLRLRTEQLLGCRTDGGSEVGPLLLRYRGKDGSMVEGVIEIVHPDQAEKHSAVSRLGFTGAHLYIVLRIISPRRSSHVLLLWAAHTAAAEHKPGWEKIADSAETALRNFQSLLTMTRQADTPKLHGIVMCSDQGVERSEVVAERKELMLLAVPVEPRCWMSAVEDLYLSLDIILKVMCT